MYGRVPPTQDLLPSTEPVHAASLLSLSGVGKWFWRGSVRVDVLRDASLDVGAGELVAVWGRLGSGKTTLLRVAAALDRPDEGIVRFAGRSLGGLPRDELQRVRRHEIGFADRSGPLEPELTALDHVAFPLIGTMPRTEARRRASDALVELGVDPACAELTWAELTDGERTLVSLAHAVVRRPKLLLVDDPTSSLGVHERERTMALLHRLASERKMAVLMTAPDMAAALGADHVHVLSGGELLPAGPAPSDDNLLQFPDAHA
jgi:ABC-type lipoprotein export system ATPase subunit